MKLKSKIAALMLVALASTQAHAVLHSQVSANAYISMNGLDWAWANPVSGADLSYQAQFGWRLPTLQELASAPLAIDFLFVGANAGFGPGAADPVSGSYFTYDPQGTFTGAGACAAAWFSGYSHCDWGNGLGQVPGNSGWAGTPGAAWHYEQLVVRESAQVSEPLSLSMLGLGLLGLAATRRKLQK